MPDLELVKLTTMELTLLTTAELTAKGKLKFDKKIKRRNGNEKFKYHS